jgi:hypothetical protein
MLTIRPASGVSATIKGSITGSLIELNGVNYMNIDGSNSGGSDRNLLLYNSGSASNATVIYLTSPGGLYNGASNCVIKNCRIKSFGHVSNTTYGIRTNTTKGMSLTSSGISYGGDATFTTLAIPVNTTVQGDTVHNGQDTCFNATSTITHQPRNPTRWLQKNLPSGSIRIPPQALSPLS